MPRKSRALTTAQRARMPKSDYVFPSRAPAVGAYPINDLYHARLAIQLAQLSPKGRRDLPKVKKAVFARYPSLIDWWNEHHPDQKWRGKRPTRVRAYPRRGRKLAANPATRKQIADEIAQIEADEGNRYGWTRRWKKSFAAMSLGEDPNAWPSFGADDGPLDWSGDRWLVGRDWDDEDFAEVYAHFEGELPPTTHPWERGNPRSNPSSRRKRGTNPATRKQIADKIAQLEDNDFWTEHTKKDFHGMATGRISAPWQYYSDWDEDDFGEVYGHFEGKLAQLDLDDERRERGYRSNIGEGYATEEEWEEFREYVSPKPKKKKKAKKGKKAKSRVSTAGKQGTISEAKRELRAKYRKKDKNWFNKTKTSERFQEEWIEIRRKIVKRSTR